MSGEGIKRIKAKIEDEIAGFLEALRVKHRLDKISPETYRYIKDFSLRGGKRFRPVLFVLSYLGASRKPARGLYKSAVAVELIHAFVLIHDDIIDRSPLRRGAPSLHAAINDRFAGSQKKFKGEDIALIIGDIFLTAAIQAFLKIDEDKTRKEAALERMLTSALLTGCGEVNELLYGLKALKKISKDEIYSIYDLKTADYSFITPLVTGATLAGADRKLTDDLTRIGSLLGRAYQIRDDLIGIFGDEKSIGKSPLTDISEAKRTLLIWYAYNNSGTPSKGAIERIFSKKAVADGDLLKIAGILKRSGAVDWAQAECDRLIREAQDGIAAAQIKRRQKDDLLDLIGDIFSPDIR